MKKDYSAPATTVVDFCKGGGIICLSQNTEDYNRKHLDWD